jgi:DNA ligase 1
MKPPIIHQIPQPVKAFSQLFTEIDQTTATNEKIEALAHYFKIASDEDAIWCVALLTGRRPKRSIKTSELKQWCLEISELPQWLWAESYLVVGDLAETISLLLPPTQKGIDYPLHKVMKDLIALQDSTENDRKQYVISMWESLGSQERFVFNKIITGGFRMGVSEKLLIKGLAMHSGIDENVIAHRLSGAWEANGNTIANILGAQEAADDISKPYPFYLAYQLDEQPESLGNVSDWQIERKYDGIRGQIIVRRNQLFVWSRGEDLLTDKFIEFHPLPHILPQGTVIDGEILPLKDGIIMPFHLMQTRIGRKNVTRKSLTEAPLVMICYDLLEHAGVDIRHLSLAERRAMLETIVYTAKQTHLIVPLELSPVIDCKSWDEVATERASARSYQCEGLMLKRKSSEYKTGRRRGDWWKWKVNPLSVDGVLIYAQRGHGRRADLYTDFTFAVWDGDELVPFAKAYSGLTDKEMLEVDTWIKKNTLDKFGPVRSVKQELVFEIGFEGINPSPRHKSGVALRFPRILRWRQDKSAKDANSKADLLQLLQATKDN